MSNSLIIRAKQWAKNLRNESTKSWKNREQDRNYRKFITRPNLYRILKSLKPLNNGIFLDVGCGDGSETVYLKDCLVKFGNIGKMYGFDPQENFIKIAKKIKSKNSKLSLHFGDDSFDKFIQKYQIKKSVDLIISIFVLQDIPDINNFLNNIDGCLSQKGRAIFLLVHPNFAENMLKKDALKINKDLTPDSTKTPWRFAAKYPIVEERGRTFFVPYFHRTIRDYRKIVKKYFRNVKFINLEPSPKDIKICKKQNKSPFYNHKGNVYYPEIIKMNSSLIILGCK